MPKLETLTILLVASVHLVPSPRHPRNSRSAVVVTKLLDGRKDSLYADLVEDDGLRVSHGRGDGYDDDEDDLEDFPDVGRLLPPIAPASV